MFYLAFDQEPLLDALMSKVFSAGKIVTVPQILEGQGKMEAVLWQPSIELEEGRFGIRQIPEAKRIAVDPSEIDLIVVPSLALDKKGTRLGMGGGYYDRFLAQLSARTVLLGVCWQEQLQDELPVEAHDRRLHYVLTEKEFFEVLA